MSRYPRPKESIELAGDNETLAVILEDVMHRWYPNGTIDGWKDFVDKYKDLPTAKKSAVRMYQRKLNGIKR